MYKHYCKDSNCPGHTKSWERCCDMRAFATRTTNRYTPFQAKPNTNTSRSMIAKASNRVFA